jgi:hypothetical protein
MRNRQSSNQAASDRGDVAGLEIANCRFVARRACRVPFRDLTLLKLQRRVMPSAYDLSSREESRRPGVNVSLALFP